MKTYWRIISYVKPYLWKVLLHALFIIISILLLASSVAFLDTIFKLLFSSESALTITQLQDSPFKFLKFFHEQIIQIIENNQDNKLPALGFTLILVVGMNTLGNVLRFFGIYFMNYVRTKIIQDIRADTFYKITKLQIAYFEGKRKGDILTRMTSDLMQIESSVVVTLESIIRDPFTLGAFLYLMIAASYKLTLFIFILLPVSALIISLIGKSLRKDSYKTQEKLSWIMSIIDEFTTGIRIVKAFNAEKYIKEVFNKYNLEYSFYSRRQQNKQRSIPMISESLGVITMGVFLWIGGKLVFQGELQESLIITFVILFQQMMQPAKKLSSAYGNIMKGIASGDRLFKLKDSPILIKDIDNPVEFIEFRKEIRFDDVSFAYNTEKVLKNINLSIPKGKIFALVGPSGGGKSTMAELVLRFYDVLEGRILIDNHDIRDMKVYDLRQLIAIVTQEPILFNDTIFNNIAFGLKDIPEEKVINAAKAANAHDFILETNDGYRSFIGDRGLLLSGGQRQRLSIARAILKNPPILILDEATSALDTSSEKIVQDALYELMKNRTSIVIAHRLSTIQNADKIVVLDKGEIVQTGGHKELISQAGLYKKLYELQQLATE